MTGILIKDWLLEKLTGKNEVNWNILLTSGKEIKRDSTINVNESRRAYIKISKMVRKLFENMGNLPQRLNIIHEL